MNQKPINRFLLTLALTLALGPGCAAILPGPGGAQGGSPTPTPSFSPTGELVTVTYLDVGQGDSEVIQTPHGHTILIDAGEGPECRQVVEPFLAKKQISTIDLFVITHPHQDHYGSYTLFSKAKINQVWEPGMANPSSSFKSLIDAISANTTPKHPRNGYTAKLDGTDIEVLAPSAPLLTGTDSDPNNASIVFRLTYGNNRFLFTGDCELESWDRIFNGSREKLKADVLKVAHHGSRNGTNSGVLVNVKPSYAVISCGENNSYGHPHQETLSLLQKANVKVYRTDQDGDITCQSDGESLKFSTEN